MGPNLSVVAKHLPAPAWMSLLVWWLPAAFMCGSGFLGEGEKCMATSPTSGMPRFPFSRTCRPRFISPVFWKFFSVIKIFISLCLELHAHTSLSQILHITCSVVLDFRKENAGMLSAPSHTSIETSKPTACGLLEQTKMRAKMQGEKEIYMYINWKKLNNVPCHITPACLCPIVLKTLAKPPVPRACCGPQPQTKFWSYLAVVIQTRRRREVKTQIFRKRRNLLGTLSLWNTDQSSLPQLVSLLDFPSLTHSCVGQ